MCNLGIINNKTLFSEREIIKQCLEAVAEVAFLDQKKKFISTIIL
jgi:hypothetical protein